MKGVMNMQQQVFELSGKDGHFTRLHAFFSEAAPQASVLVLHGMAEHHERYLEFAQALTDSGIDVYLYDHRGHGKDCKLEELGHLASSKGYRKLIDDALRIAEFVRQTKRSDAYFIFGHSMGSLVTRCVLQKDDAFSGAMICGSTCPARLTIASGLFVSSLIRLFRGAEHRSPFMNHLLFENRQYLKLSTRTVMDWLTRDNNVVGVYLHDPYCGFLCSASFYHDLIKLSAIARRRTRMLHTRRELPLFFLSGNHDPVGGYGRQITFLSRFYQKHGYTDVTCKLYPEDRHELLNELDKETVIRDLIDWITAHCS